MKMVFHTQHISSFHVVPRTSARTQLPCWKHRFLPSLLQSTHIPVKGEQLHGSIKAAGRKHLNLSKAFHLSNSTNRQTQYSSFFSHTRLVLWGYAFPNKVLAALQVKYCDQIYQKEKRGKISLNCNIQFWWSSVYSKAWLPTLSSLPSCTSVKDTTSPMAPDWLNS